MINFKLPSKINNINFNLQTVTGIYLGAKEVYMAQLKGSIFGIQLVKFGSSEIKTPMQTGELTKEREQAIVQAIKKLVQENKITGGQVIAALPGKDVLIRYFQMPKIPKPEWENAIKFEAKKYIPLKIEELIWSFQVTYPKGKGKGKSNKMDVTFVGIKKYLGERYISLFQEAGLKPSVLEPSPFSMVRLFALSHQLVKDRPIAIVDVDYGVTDINIVKHKICYLTRDASVPLEGELVFDSLLNEIRMSIDYYEKLFPAEQVAKILLCGEVKLQDWDKKLAQELKMPVEKVNLAGAIRFEKVAPTLDMSVAIGSALNGLIESGTTVNLLRVIKAKAEITSPKELLTPEIKIAVFRALTISCLGLFALHLIMRQGITHQKRLLEDAIAERPKIVLVGDSFSREELEALKKKLEKKTSSLDLTIAQRTFLTNKFNELPKVVPPGVWCRSLSFTDDLTADNKIIRSLTIQGTAQHEDSAKQVGMVTRLVSNLQKNEEFSSSFKEIKLRGMSSAELEGRSVKNFIIDCSFK